MNADPGDDLLLEIESRMDAARAEFDAQTRRFEDIRTQLLETFAQLRDGRPRQEILRSSAFARLQAKLDTMPVIEQAKGVLMAQNRCGPEEAFELLRRASQRANVKVVVLATEIVEQVASPGPQSAESLPRTGTGGHAAGRPAIRRLRQRT